MAALELIKLYEHQTRFIDGLRQSLVTNAAVMGMMPTGGGKTIVAAAIATMTVGNNCRVFFIADSLELIDQTVATFERVGLRCGVIQGQHPKTDREAPVQVCTIQTLRSRWADVVAGGRMPQLVIIDEAHVIHQQHKAIIAECAHKKVPVIGLSATPFRAGLSNLFSDLVVGATTQELIDGGFLSPARYFAPHVPNLKGIKSSGGDYVEAALADVMGDSKIIGDIVSHWREYSGENRQTLVFAVNVAHSKALRDAFRAAGVNCEHIDGYDKDLAARQAKIKAFREGRIKVLVNCNILTKGFDAPETGCIVLARPTKSLSLHIQQLGRGLRTAPGKTDCVVIDHAGNLIRNGLATDPLPTELDDGKLGERADRRKEEKKVKEKICSHCGSIRVRPKCDACGFEAEFIQDVESGEGRLVELRQTNRKTELQDKRQFYGELRGLAQMRGYSQHWADHKYREKFGVWPNRIKDVKPRSPQVATLNWVKSRNIAWFKARSQA